MKDINIEAKQITQFSEPYSRFFSQVSRDAHLSNTSLAEQFLLAENLLLIESIQRSEAWESAETIHTLRQPPSNVRLISDYRQTA